MLLMKKTAFKAYKNMKSSTLPIRFSNLLSCLLSSSIFELKMLIDAEFVTIIFGKSPSGFRVQFLVFDRLFVKPYLFP